MSELKLTSQIPQNLKAGLSFCHHSSENSVCTFETEERCEFILHLSRNIAALGCVAVFFDEYLEPTNISVVGEWQGIEKGFDKFVFSSKELTDAPSLKFFYIKIETADHSLYIKKCGNVYVTESDEKKDLFQILVSEFKYSVPEKILGGVIYHIFVDRFNRGGDVPVSDGALLVPGEWEYIPEFPEYPGAPLKNNTFYGGTLYGIIDKLDYIKSLGVSAIYLSPIFSSVSNHKYDTADYMTVDEMFGGDKALAELIREADKRDISIILDGVFNHTGDDSVYFNKYSRFDSVGAYNSKNSKYYSWFDFQNYPDKYTCWWNIPILPRINPDNPSCEEYLVGENGVVSKYRKMGVYGFRLDVADELSDSFISKAKARLSDGGESVLYGEVWEDASNKIAYDKRKKYYQGCELDGVMNYPLRDGITDYIVNKKADKLSYFFNEVLNNTPPRIRNVQMNLLGSHDTIRSITALSGCNTEGKTNAELRLSRLAPDLYCLARKRLISAYTILATLPGIPSIFYGDEVGLQGYSDPFCRMPYPWGREDENLLVHYKKIGQIRKKNPAYRDGDFELLHLSDDLLLFARYDGKSAYLTIYNNSEKEKSIVFDSQVSDLISSKKNTSFIVDGGDSLILKMKKETVFEIISEENK